MTRHLTQEISRLLDYVCKTEGWQREPRRRHHKVTGPEGQVVICALTPSCSRALENTRRDLRQAGATLPPKRDLPKGKR